MAGEQKLALAFWASFAALLILANLEASPIYIDVCEPAYQNGAKECASYRVLPGVFVYVSAYLESHNGLVTAIATVGSHAKG